VTVDAHVHLWRLARGDNVALTPSMKAIYFDREPEDLKPHLDACGVERVVVVQAAETLAETLYTIGLARKFPWIAGIVAWVDPASPAIEEEIAALTWIGIVKGVRPVRGDNSSIAWMLDRQLERGWVTLAEHDLALDILVQNWREMPLAAQLLRRLPSLRIVLDHCGKPDIAGGAFSPWARHIEEIAALPNTYCKFSGLMNCAFPGATSADVKPYAEHVLDAFGCNRVLWASDWPPLEVASEYSTWKRVSDEILAAQSDHFRAAVMVKSAEHIYRLGAQTGREDG
jgi:L-fuconolactonase